jgi:hypothetical protein
MPILANGNISTVMVIVFERRSLKEDSLTVDINNVGFRKHESRQTIHWSIKGIFVTVSVLVECVIHKATAHHE